MRYRKIECVETCILFLLNMRICVSAQCPARGDHRNTPVVDSGGLTRMGGGEDTPRGTLRCRS